MTPSPTTDIPGPDLFMTVIKVRSWEESLRWYSAALGLFPVLTDAVRGFVLLAAGNGRLALQQRREDDPGEEPRRDARLVFLVPDVEAEYRRLAERGIEVTPPALNARENFTEIRLHDPDGVPLTLFSWTRPDPVAGPDA
ncbi:VOC family protein [Aquisphaera insulae]|uniref:VOC family protein n=1 Tax=Aquisphaera insulae TaxID=2712864 RepID=UPI0013ECF639|nr:VOC family protein [Aquisphaera insulae]